MANSAAIANRVAQRICTEAVEELVGATPSFAFAVFDRGGILHENSRGSIRLDGSRPTPETVYRICSMSKSFLTAVVLILEERGLVDLEAPIKEYVPEFPDFEGENGIRVGVTVKMLLSNSSGLPEDNAWADESLDGGREDLLRILRDGVRFADTPGRCYQYSNLGFATLGLLVENVTGENFYEFARRELLDPLGLQRTRWSRHDYDTDGLSSPVFATGYSTFDGGTTWHERPFIETGLMGCPGTMFSTVGDIAKWSAWLSSAFDPTNRDDRILSMARRRRMQRIQTAKHAEDHLYRPEVVAAGYGLGLAVEIDREFGTLVYHTGGLPGFSSNMRWHADSGLGVVSFANANDVRVDRWNQKVLSRILREVDLPARHVKIWPESFDAASRIDEMVRGGKGFASLAELFTRNVPTDIPYSLRDERLARLVTAAGGIAPAAPLRARLKWAVSEAQIIWSIPCRAEDLQCRIEMSPLHDTKVQRVVVERQLPASGDPDCPPSLVTQRFVPVPPEGVGDCC